MNERRGTLRNATSGEVIASDARLAAGPLALLLGLIGRAAVPPDFALALPGCDWVHTVGVGFAIDVAYCDPAGRVVLVVADLPPGRVAPRARGARVAWETRAGRMDGRVRIGDTLVWEPAGHPPPLGGGKMPQ